MIAPEIISGIKSEMYGSLFSAHMGRYCLENLHYSMNAAMNASVKRALLIHGFSFSKSSCGYKSQERGFCQKHQSIATMAFSSCSCSRPPEFYVVPSNK